MAIDYFHHAITFGFQRIICEYYSWRFECVRAVTGFFQKHMINDKSEHMSKTILQIYRYIQRIAQPEEDLTPNLFYFQLAHQIMSCQANESANNMQSCELYAARQTVF